MSSFSWYVNHLSNGCYTAKVFDLLWIDLNYNFLIKNLNKNAKILEVWPWTWFFIDWLLSYWFSNITFVDLDEKNVEQLNKKYSNYSHVKWYYWDGIEFLNSQKEKYDLIVSRQVIEHLEFQAILNYYMWASLSLNKKWYLITETINSQNIYYGYYLRYCDFSHKNSFSEKSFKEYSSKYFSQKSNTFREFKNLSLFQIIRYILLKKRLYKLFFEQSNLWKIFEQQKNLSKTANWNILFKIYRSILRSWRFYRSEIISKKYLYEYDRSITVFSPFIIQILRKD